MLSVRLLVQKDNIIFAMFRLGGGGGDGDGGWGDGHTGARAHRPTSAGASRPWSALTIAD